MEIGLLQKHILNLSPNLQKKQNMQKTMLQEIAESRIKSIPVEWSLEDSIEINHVSLNLFSYHCVEKHLKRIDLIDRL